MAKRAYKYRFYPTSEQEQLLAQTFGCVRFVYNDILRWRTDAYYNDGSSVDYLAANSRLTEMKKSGDYPWLSEVSSVPLQQSLRHQQRAFKNFFEGRARYPVFKKKSRRQSAEFTRSAFKYTDGQLYLAKIKEPLNIRWSRNLPSTPSTITVSKDPAGRYFVSCLCEFDPKPLPVVNKTVGVDMGLTQLFCTSDGNKIGNPRYTANYERRLARAQRNLSKKKLGSANRAKAKRQVARIHAKISDCRRDFLHKQSRGLINENQVICVETLKVKNMLRNQYLSKAISDAGWGGFIRQLAYKAEWADRQLVKIDQWFPSSKRCSACGHIVNTLPLNIRSWTCPECGADHDRDINAAVNIKAVGHTVLAFGENVSLKSDISGISNSR